MLIGPPHEAVLSSLMLSVEDVVRDQIRALLGPANTRYLARFYRAAARGGAHYRTHPRDLLWAYRRGFLPGQVPQWGLRESGPPPTSYLSERHRLWLEEHTRTPLDQAFEDKVLFHTVELGLDHIRCGFRGVVINGHYFPSERAGAGGSGAEALANAAKDEALVIKPAVGNSSRSVLVLGTDEPSVRLQTLNRPSRDDLEERLRGHGRSVVTTLARPGAYARTIAPGLEGKVEILVARPCPGEAAAVLRAQHLFAAAARLDGSRSRPWHISAPIDVVEGVMGVAKRHTNQGSHTFPTHPDSGAPIDGVELPYWNLLCEGLLGCLDRHPTVPFLVCDVILTDDGPRVIEAERTIDITSFQAHGPLASNPVIAALSERVSYGAFPRV